MRETCDQCHSNPKAINYKKQEKVYYRSLCDACIVKARKNTKPLWVKQGYKKKLKCESCEFVAKLPDQLTVCDYKGSWHTVCLNCDVYIKTTNILIKKSNLRSDF